MHGRAKATVRCVNGFQVRARGKKQAGAGQLRRTTGGGVLWGCRMLVGSVRTDRDDRRFDPPTPLRISLLVLRPLPIVYRPTLRSLRPCDHGNPPLHPLLRHERVQHRVIRRAPVRHAGPGRPSIQHVRDVHRRTSIGRWLTRNRRRRRAGGWRCCLRRMQSRVGVRSGCRRGRTVRRVAPPLVRIARLLRR